MVLSLNKGTPVSTPKSYDPYYGDPQKGIPHFGNSNKLLKKTECQGALCRCVAKAWRMRISWDNGKEHGNYYNIICGLYRGYIYGLYRGYTGIMEKKMETTV